MRHVQNIVVGDDISRNIHVSRRVITIVGGISRNIHVSRRISTSVVAGLLMVLNVGSNDAGCAVAVVVISVDSSVVTRMTDVAGEIRQGSMMGMRRWLKTIR
ncbi:hypothetical protein PBRA_009604 [Plasmodiophora brassicae]|uniref:Uncharacterized protein n=1 Tax=Plasmodiophora brassicae TaxID=37360 RepID=A0A0G4IJ12_PLABS|nr:hypothetical protein PBRA_009604 [Plasmodiophora brassicae]